MVKSYLNLNSILDRNDATMISEQKTTVTKKKNHRYPLDRLQIKHAKSFINEPFVKTIKRVLKDGLFDGENPLKVWIDTYTADDVMFDFANINDIPQIIKEELITLKIKGYNYELVFETEMNNGKIEKTFWIIIK